MSMSRQIKARDVKPGMRIGYDNGSAHGIIEVTRCGQGLGEVTMSREDDAHVTLLSSAVVTVLREPQPEEPTAFGACVEAGGVSFIRVDDDDAPWATPTPGGGFTWASWGTITSRGPVTVVTRDPFAKPQPAQREPRVWENWADVPEGVDAITRSGDVCQKDGEVILLRFGAGWAQSLMDGSEIQDLAPFTEVLP